MASSWRTLDDAMRLFNRVTERAERCPLRASRELLRLGKRLLQVTARLERAARRLGETTDSLARERGPITGAPQLLTEATVRWLATAKALAESSSCVFDFHEHLLEDVRSGELVPEAETPRRRPRIVVIPRLISARDFLLCRRSSAHDRIALIPPRRRRVASPRGTDAPRRISRGRAPPLASSSLL